MNRKNAALASLYIFPVLDGAEELIRLQKKNTLIVELSDLQRRLSLFAENNNDIMQIIRDIQMIKEMARDSDPTIIIPAKERERIDKELILAIAGIYSKILQGRTSILINFEGRVYRRDVITVPRVGEFVEITDLSFARVVDVEHHIDGSVSISCSTRSKAGDIPRNNEKPPLSPMKKAIEEVKKVEEYPMYNAQGIHRNDCHTIE